MLVRDRPPHATRCRAAWSLAAAAAAVALTVAASGLRLDASPRVQGAPPTPAQAGDREWSGVIVDRATGHPVAGAAVRVEVATYRDAASGATTGTLRRLREVAATTPADGTYRFSLSAEEQADRGLFLTAFVDHPGYVHWYGGGGYRDAVGVIEMGDRPFFERVELIPGVPVTGLVLGPDGAPAAGVKITGFTDPLGVRSGVNLGNFVETRADASGRFRLPLHPTGRAVFTVLPVDAEPEVVPLKGGRRGDVGTIRLGRGIRLRGRILDAAGRPVAGAYVLAFRSDVGRTTATEEADGIPAGISTNVQRTALTGPDGMFELAPLPPGVYQVRPVTDGADPATRDGLADPPRRPLPGAFPFREVRLEAGVDPGPVEFRPAPAVTVRAQFVDGRGRKRGGWEVDLHGKVAGQFWSSTTEPDASGALAILAPRGLTDATLGVTGHESDVISLRLAPGGLLIDNSDALLGTLDADRSGIEILVADAPTLFIRAAARDGRPVPGAKVEVKPVPRPGGALGRMADLIAGRREGADVWVEGPQADGRFRTAHLSPGVEVEATVTADGFAPASRKVTLPEGKVEEVTLTLDPVAGPPPAPPAAPAPAAAAAAADDREWSGRVVDAASGRPIAGARVRAIVGYNGASVDDPRGRPRVVEQVTPADGSYRFAVRPAEAADPSLFIGLDVEEPNHVAFNRAFSYRRSLELLVGEGRRPEFEAVALREAKVVTMQVLTPDGVPAAGVEVRGVTWRAINSGHRETARPTARTDAEGRFRMPLHVEGPATLRFMPDDFEPATVVVRMEQAGDLGTLRLGRGARIAGTVVDVDGRPLGGVAVRAAQASRTVRPTNGGFDFTGGAHIREATTRDDGSFAFAPLPPGKYEVQVAGITSVEEWGWKSPQLADACVLPRSIELEAGRDPAPIALQAVPHAIVAVRLLDGPGPVPAGRRDIEVVAAYNRKGWLASVSSSGAGDYRVAVPRDSAYIKVMTPSIDVAATYRVRQAAGLDPAAAKEFGEAVAGRGDPDWPHRSLGAAPMLRGRDVRIDPFNGDVYVEFAHAASPTLTIRAVDGAGLPLTNARVAIHYVAPEDRAEAKRNEMNGGTSDVSLREAANKGSWTTARLLPDAEFEVTATADGFRPKRQRLVLPPGRVDALTLSLNPE